MYGQRILILIPHPDDEVVGCAAAILRARERGAEVFGLFLTTGVPAKDVVWPWRRRRHADMVATRRAEAEKTARLLGVNPCGWSGIPTRSLKDHLVEARALALNAIRGHAIDTLWTSAYEGGHQDHDAANVLAASLKDIEPRLPVFEFAEYNFAGGRARTHVFPFLTGGEIVIDLAPTEADVKRQALALYRSERANLAFIHAARECFRPLSPYDYSRPPHAGTLFYERFQWVPFRHPRVAFDPPARVSAAFAAFRPTA
jgi:LmbE family N-acetylglucosaminyl deacetylase